MSTARSLKRKADAQLRKTEPDPPTSDGSVSEHDSEYDAEDTFVDPMIDSPASSIGAGDEVEDIRPVAGPSKSAKTGLYKPPTLAELDLLRAAESTGSNTFTLQLEALLASTLLPTAPNPQLKSLLSALHSHILSLPTLPPLPPREAAKRTAVTFPGPEELSPLSADAKWTLAWEKPEEMIVGGSWPVCGGYRKGRGEIGGVDVVVVMPRSLFSPKDRMSYRYFHKRAHYLAVIKASLDRLPEDSSLSGVEMRWEYANGDERRPIITFSVGKEHGLRHRVDITIHASIPSDVFPHSSLSPSKALVRPSTEPTPLYSTSLLHDTLHKAHLLHLYRLAQLLPDRVVDSFLALWRIWAGRRGICRGRGGSGWFGGMMLGWVVEGGDVGGVGGVRERVRRVRGLGKGLGYWGAMRAAWEFLAHTDFHKTPVFLASSSDSAIPASDFSKKFEDVLADPSGCVNIFAEWEKGEIQLLQHHARGTLAMLEDSAVDHFADVFLRNHTLGPAVFDEHMSIDVSDISDHADLHSRAERPSRFDLLASTIAVTLRRGLGDRARLITVTPSADSLNVGMFFDPAQAARVLDVGPPSEQTQACEAFRNLWGEKAELRRFKDGSITESVVWDLARPEDAALVPSRIVTWLLGRHHSMTEHNVRRISSNPGWLSILQIPGSARDAVDLAGSEKLGFRPLIDAYGDLYKLLKSIDIELPLAILQVTPASELLRYSSPFVPHPIDVNRYPSAPECLKHIPCAEIVMQFESSPRWPDDLAAIQKVKLALLEKVARVIATQRRTARTHISLDRTGEIEDYASLEVLLPQGVAFRVRIFHERERTLLERAIQDDSPVFGTSLPQPPRRLALPALAAHLRRFVHLPQHHSSVAPLHHRYPSYSSATRLLKRWFAAHMLSLHVATEVTELIMASVYLNPGPLHTPSSAVTGFVRAIRSLALWDWRTTPLVVPVFSASRADSGGRMRFPPEKRVEAEQAFAVLRSRDKEITHGAWVVVTEEDVHGLRWTEKPSKVVAGRVMALAKATLSAIQTDGEINVKSLFTTPLEQYDFLIHLHPSTLSRYAQAVAPDAVEWEAKLKYRNLQPASNLRIYFDPAEAFSRDIQRLYGETVLVFFDIHGGSVIGCLWNPSKSQPRNLKPFLGYSTRPVPEVGMVALDTSAVLGEIGRLGKGLIERIEVRRGIEE